jgi:hypothetical protein
MTDRSIPPILPTRPLTVREEAVAKCVARGLNYKRIGAVVGISPRTAEYYVLRIADTLPHGDPEEDELKPYDRVLVWAYWEFRLRRVA